MDLKNAIISAVAGNAVSKKTDKPYSYIDVVFKGTDGVVICKRVFVADYEKTLLGL